MRIIKRSSCDIGHLLAQGLTHDESADFWKLICKGPANLCHVQCTGHALHICVIDVDLHSHEWKVAFELH